MQNQGGDDRPPRPSEELMAGGTGGGSESEGGTETITRETRLERRIYGSVSRQSFYSALSLSTLFLVVVSAMVFSAGTVAGTALGAGFGGFVAEFGALEADEGTIFPVLDEQPACENAPQLMATLRGQANVTDHIAFYKDLPLPASNFTNSEIARVSIVSDLPPGEKVHAQDLDLRFTALVADFIELGGSGGEDVTLREFGPETTDGTGDDPGEDPYSQDRLFGLNNADYEFGVGAEGEDVFYLKNGTAVAHHLSFAQLEVPDVDLFVGIGEESEFTATGVDPRVVNPADRDCASLAQG